jgi:NitT/TauT family transport system ATP-binding protein
LPAGLLLGLWLGLHRFAGDVADPILGSLYSIPKITLYPLILLLFGLGMSAKVAFGVIHGVLPIAIFTISAVRGVAPIYLKTARMLRMSRSAIAMTIFAPAALPEIVAGIRVGVALTLLGTLIGELFAATTGIGFALIRATDVHDVADILALTLLLFLFAALINGLLHYGERRMRHERYRGQITLRGVTKVFAAADGRGAAEALGPVGIDIAGGEFFSVVGPSGCGKSTLLDIIAGLSSPTTGEANFDGKPLTGGVPDGVGAVLQQDASFFWLNVWDNVAFGLRRNGVDTAEIRRRVSDALSFMGLTEFASAYPAQLSGGMRQGVCIARTFVLKPRLLLLDEPFGALDQQTRLVMGDELLRVWREIGATVILITHSREEAAMLSDRVAVMSARPGRFIDIVVTRWPRSRDSRIIADERFGGITARLWGSLREESLKSLGSAGGAATLDEHR